MRLELFRDQGTMRLGRSKRSATVVLMLVALLVLILTSGCSDRDDSTAPTTPAPSVESARCVPTRPVEVLGTWTDAEQNNFQRILDTFEETSNIDVRYTWAGREIADALDADLMRQNPPDIAILPQPGLLQELVEDGRLISIEDLSGDVERNFGQAWAELGEGADGELYGVWFKANNKSTIWFDVEAFADAEVNPKDLNTWTALLTEADRLASSGKTPFSVAGAEGDAWVLTDWFENVYLRTAGLDNYRKLTQHEIPWDDDTVKTALRALAEIFSNERWLAGGIDRTLKTDFPTSVNQVFANTSPKAMMVYEGDFVTGFIPPRAMPNADFFDFPDFPDFPGMRAQPRSVIVGGNVAVLLKPGSNQQENCGAKELMRALTTAEAVEPWATTGGGFSSANANILSMLPSEPAKKAAAELQTQTIVFDLSDQQPPVFGATPGKGMYEILRKFVRDPGNVDSTAAQLEQARLTAS